MAVDQKSQTKEVVRRSAIRTMKKDIRRLRETDTVKESEKIIKLDLTPPPAPVKPFDSAQGKPAPIVPPKPSTPVIKTPAPLPARPSKEALFAKEHATEPEKQQMFALESKKNELARQLAEKEKQSAPVAFEKNRLAEQQRQWQEKAGQMDAKKADEKERFPIDRELSNITGQLQRIEGQYSAALGQEQQIKQEIKAITSALEDVYTAIRQRYEAKAAASAAQAVKPPQEEKQPQPEPLPTKEPSYLKEVPASAKKSIIQAGAKENEQRKKFMEDVERWIQSTQL